MHSTSQSSHTLHSHGEFTLHRNNPHTLPPSQNDPGIMWYCVQMGILWMICVHVGAFRSVFPGEDQSLCQCMWNLPMKLIHSAVTASSWCMRNIHIPTTSVTSHHTGIHTPCTLTHAQIHSPMLFHLHRVFPHSHALPFCHPHKVESQWYLGICTHAHLHRLAQVHRITPQLHGIITLKSQPPRHLSTCDFPPLLTYGDDDFHNDVCGLHQKVM